MGAGKTTLGAALAERLGRPFVDADAAVEAATGCAVADLFREGTFREHEARAVAAALAGREPLVVALGGGAVESPAVREALRDAFTLLVEVDADTAWARVAGGDRPLAQDETSFRELYERRAPLYAEVADAAAADVEGAVLAAGGVHVESGSLGRLATLVPGDAAVELVTDARVAGIHGMEAQLGLGGRARATHEVPAGEEAKQLAVAERLWRGFRLDRDGVLVALGGGATTDVAGFAAATYLRGVPWVPVPTTLVGQVDAAIGGKTAVDLPEGKNLVGAFHWPVRTVIDPELLDTLPEGELLNGRAELVKTGLLLGERLWELPSADGIRLAAAFKVAVCLRDPYDRGPRQQLNLGHTFAHALEAAADFSLPHGRAVALGLLAALRLSGVDTRDVERELRPEPVRVDRDRAWAALARDKKASGGSPRLVLLDAPGRPRTGVEVPPADVRAALDSLIAG